MTIKVNYLAVLKIINDHNQDITADLLYHKVQSLNNDVRGKWERDTFYSVINLLEAKKLLTKKRIKKIPPEISIKITQKAQDMLKFFESGKNKENKIIKKNVSVGMTSQEYKNLDDDEIAECAQEVAYKIIAGMNKEPEELTENESGKITKAALGIVKYVRGY